MNLLQVDGGTVQKNMLSTAANSNLSADLSYKMASTENPTQTADGSSQYSLLVLICGGLLLIVALTLINQIRLVIQRAMATSSTSGEASILPVLFYGAIYIAASSALIKYNKYLITPGRFPFALNLTFGQQVIGSTSLAVTYFLKPAHFSSLSDPEKSKDVTSRFWLMAVLPIALCFSGELVLSNSAYEFSSVAFLQMMKESNIVLVYIMSMAAQIECFDSTRARILFGLFLSTSLTVQGELAFDVRGFSIQGTSQILGCSKIVLQSVLLSAAGSKGLDALSYNLMVQPTTAFTVAVYVVFCMLAIPQIETASLADYAVWWPHLLANGLTALALNLTVSAFIARTSAVGFIIVGILKDVCVIMFDVLISGTPISNLQIGAFACQVCFVGCYSLVKSFSKEAAHPSGKKA